ncbi:MAG: hypothetical protein A3C27_03745 [Candidatus Levybacteria bacterium RIFCSPHIGHO2_02_FULL_39_36]|nr:MAG: hypothetical protein A3C27_03745 [Candidatus Levybacteria bacterium RIFCSPHIGHO2_02_FULL_39_36]OGH45610.1 MAG: hypothetical protein A3H82_00015 [Candidatus Levybacteria bacterium RIFCSPLOWO2_02_FULL_39_26]OGH47784.1 MAG: hypothetical protein A3G66_01870 [Candidatus Levybacteria bacterium RIFCSPLOWO2_12_FULL_39_17]
MLRLIYASSISASVTAILTVVLTIWAELSVSFKDGLKNISGHHWITKSIFAVIAYLFVLFLVYSLNKNVSADKIRESLYRLIIVTILGSLTILGFYIWHFFR